LFKQPTCSSRAIRLCVLPVRKAGEVESIEELEELNRELDVADASVAGLDVAGGGALLVGRCSIRRFSAWDAA
jgi:hypothetical protein